jgi:hypothetical protein
MACDGVEGSMTSLEEMLRTPPGRAIDSKVICVLTRFRLKGPQYVLPTYYDFRRVVREAAEVRAEGLLQAAFLLGGPATCYSLSIWTDDIAPSRFSTRVPAHIVAGNNVMRRLAVDPDRGAELWSTKWQLKTVSHNLNWDSGFDLRKALVDEDVRLLN